jgi:hypothetical protein
VTLHELHQAHIGRVAVTVTIEHPDLVPEQLTAALGITPDTSCRRGDAEHVGTRSIPAATGSWSLKSTPHVDSKDVNEHLGFLLKQLHPHAEAIRARSRGGQVYVDVLWESSYLYAGTGPVIAAERLAGLADLGAALGFDIYEIPAQDDA